MIATTIRTPPAATDFVPLAEYQSQTPASFVDGKPVLHLHVAGAAASAPKEQVARGVLAVFPADAPTTAASGENGVADEEELVEQLVDVYVTSESFIIFSPAAEAGVSIPYPSISIHAIKQLPSSSSSAAVWMQLELSDGGSSDDDYALIELTIRPPASAAAAAAAANTLYEAIAACSNLHPDPAADDDDEDDNDDRIVFEGSVEHEALEGFSGVLRGASDGSLPPPMPGSGGWITADNVAEYFDESGNWIGPGAEVGGEDEEELGEGAGRTRARDEVEAQDSVNGHDGEEDAENKRQRVE